jgi:hypothetical protein
MRVAFHALITEFALIERDDVPDRPIRRERVPSDLGSTLAIGARDVTAAEVFEAGS